jgi:hypothetical protein
LREKGQNFKIGNMNGFYDRMSRQFAFARPMWQHDEQVGNGNRASAATYRTEAAPGPQHSQRQARSHRRGAPGLPSPSHLSGLQLTSIECPRMQYAKRLMVWALIMMTVVVSASACRGTAQVSGESSRLRGEIVELRDRIAELERRNHELETELQRSAQAPDSLPQDLRAALPHVAKIDIERLSFARDADRDGTPDVLMLYIAPSDGRGRFTQFTGELAASALLLPVQGEPLVIGQVSLSPLQVRDAYRSSITGMHYTVEVPLEHMAKDAASKTEREIFARVQYRDGVTGQAFTAERKIALP